MTCNGVQSKSEIRIRNLSDGLTSLVTPTIPRFNFHHWVIHVNVWMAKWVAALEKFSSLYAINPWLNIAFDHGKDNGKIGAIKDRFWILHQILFVMMNSSFNSSGSYFDSPFAPSFPSITLKHLDILSVVSYLVAARLLTVFYLRTFSFKEHSAAIAVDLKLLVVLQALRSAFPIISCCRTSTWWCVRI